MKIEIDAEEAEFLVQLVDGYKIRTAGTWIPQEARTALADKLHAACPDLLRVSMPQR